MPYMHTIRIWDAGDSQLFAGEAGVVRESRGQTSVP